MLAAAEALVSLLESNLAAVGGSVGAWECHSLEPRRLLAAEAGSVDVDTFEPAQNRQAALGVSLSKVVLAAADTHTSAPLSGHVDYAVLAVLDETPRAI